MLLHIALAFLWSNFCQSQATFFIPSSEVFTYCSS
uniref:Uncharacterized protein n=1 Tax=Rhizophora mucronata TaxID=61149 RepID=A0A2P2P3Q8_RHIMU